VDAPSPHFASFQTLPLQREKGSAPVAKTVFPIHLGPIEHRILEIVKEREGCSKAEAARRIIRSYNLDEPLPPPPIEHPTSEAAPSC
jgi:hypothetical protein